MKGLLLLGITAFQISSGAPAPHPVVPPVPPIRWGLWENSIAGAPEMDGDTSVTRECISSETWKGFMDTHGDDSNHCVWSNQKATATTYSADASCSSGKMTGHALITIDSPESFHYTIGVDVAKGTDHASHFDITAKSKFIGTDCFGLKPGEEVDPND